MNKHIWHTLFVTTIVSTYCNIRAAADTEITSIAFISKWSKPSDVPERFQFSDNVIIKFFDQWSAEDITHYSSTPLQAALNGDYLAIKNHWERVNKIGISPAHILLDLKVGKSLQFPPEQATRIIKYLLSTKKASANEKHERPFFTTDTPLHHAKHPEHIALLIKYGADLKAQNGAGHTPLEEALLLASVGARDIETVEAFLKDGAPIPTDRRLYCIIPSSPKTNPRFFNQVIPLLNKYRPLHAEGTNS